MSDIEDRVDRLESLVEQQQETAEQQQNRIDAQQETIEQQRERIEQQAAVIDDLRSSEETVVESDDRESDGTASISRRGAMKTAGLVGLLGAGAGAATAGPTIGEPGNQVETLYAQGLAGDLTGGATVTDLVGGGLTVSDGSLEPALSSDLTLSNGDIAVDVGPDDVGAASDSHDNAAHAQTYAVDGVAQPPEDHGNAAHTQTYAIEGSSQPPENHGNAAHTQTFAVDGSPQPPEDHGNEAHSSDFATSGEVPDTAADIGAASDNHGNGAHSTTFVSSLSGGTGISQSSIGQGDTVSVAWGDASGLDSSGQPADFSGANDLDSGGSITDFSGAAALDGSGQIADFSAANDLDSNGNVSGGGFSDAGRYLEASDSTVGFGPNAEWSGFAEGPNTINGLGSNAILSGAYNEIDGAAESVICSGGGSADFLGNFMRATFSCIIGGGSSHVIDEDDGSSTGSCSEAGIFSGSGNEIFGESNHSCITGGLGNEIDSSEEVIIAGGRSNTARLADQAFIGTGDSNEIRTGDRPAGSDGEQVQGSAIVAGRENSVSASFGSVLNGTSNEVAAPHGTVVAGEHNSVDGAHSMAAGRNATVEDDGTVAFADASEAEFAPTGGGLHTQMEAYAPELNRVVTEDVDTDRVDAETVLDQLTGVKIGPSGSGNGLCIDPETFNEAFDLDGETELGTLDVDAALLGAVRALAERVDVLERELAETPPERNER